MVPQYDRHSYETEKYEALETWDMWLSELIVEKQGSEGIHQGDPATMRLSQYVG
jgi:hypothetical protein